MSSDIVWEPVVAIEPCGAEETYDLTVEVDHNFVADGLVVHNSHSAAYSLIPYQTAFLFLVLLTALVAARLRRR